MNWLFDTEGKSVTSHAKKVVSDMHTKLDQQALYINKLESVVENLKHSSTSPIETEIALLEKRKLRLQDELLETDRLILKHKKMLQDAKSDIDGIVSGAYVVGNIGNSVKVRNLASKSNARSDIALPLNASVVNQDTFLHLDLEEENELVDTVKGSEENFLFLLHRNSIDDVFVYAVASNGGEDDDDASTRYVIDTYKLPDYSDYSTRQDISSFERMVAYGAKTSPNQDRDDPELSELTDFIVPSQIVGSPADGDGSMSGNSAIVLLKCKGELLTSIEVPLAPDVVIDIWRVEAVSLVGRNVYGIDEQSLLKGAPRFIATTSIQDVRCAILTRIYVVSEVRWGLPTVISVELYGNAVTADSRGVKSFRSLSEVVEVA
jgi:hypothetical protein